MDEANEGRFQARQLEIYGGCPFPAVNVGYDDDDEETELYLNEFHFIL